MEEYFVFITINTGAHSILLHHFLKLCMVFFSQILHSGFQAEHIKDTKQAQEEKKERYFFFMHTFEIWWWKIFFVILIWSDLMVSSFG